MKDLVRITPKRITPHLRKNLRLPYLPYLWNLFFITKKKSKVNEKKKEKEEPNPFHKKKPPMIPQLSLLPPPRLPLLSKHLCPILTGLSDQLLKAGC
jgi:hypothetical protein